MATSGQEFVWRIVPQRTPHVIKNCHHCRSRTEFASSDMFRVNRNGARVDVWLIYRCQSCSSTWNCSVRRRVNEGAIPSAVFQQYLRNDRELAWTCAFDVAIHKASGVTYEQTVPSDLIGPALDTSGRCLSAIIRVELEYPVRPRLDKLLADKLGLSRSAVAELALQGVLRTDPAIKLRRPLKGPVTVLIDRWTLPAAS